MGRLVITLAVVLALVVLVFGWTKTWSYVEGTQQVINQAADDRTPMSLEKARIMALVDKENAMVLTYEDKIGDLEARRDATDRTVAEARKKLATEADLLKRIKVLLDEKRETYLLGRDQQFSWAEINSDALERLEVVKRMQEGIAFNEALLADLDKAIKQGRGSVSEARKRLVELKSCMARLEQRNVNADVRLQVAQLANAVAGAPLASDSELEKAVRNYDRRVGQKERRAESHLSASHGQFRIDYSGALVTQDASVEIGQFLGNVSQEKPVPAAPQSRPSATEALRGVQG